MRIHHATAAKAKKFKITLTVEDNEIVATDAKGNRLAAGLQGNKVLEEAITKLTGKVAKKSTQPKPRKAKVEREDDEDTDGEEGEDEAAEIEAANDEADEEEGATESRSIVKAKYKKLYQPHKHRSGDELSHQISAHVCEENDAGEMRVSLKKLRAFAKANDCWVESYASLRNKSGEWNSGQARMNCGNRLRAKIRQAKKSGEKFEIKWV